MCSGQFFVRAFCEPPSERRVRKNFLYSSCERSRVVGGHKKCRIISRYFADAR